MAEASRTSTPDGTNKLIIHYLDNSRSQRILWLLEELEVSYEIRTYKRTSEMLAPEEMKTIHPLGKAPIISDGDLTIAESGTIVEYLISKYGDEKFKPTDAGWVDNLYFTHYSEGSLMPLLVNKLIFTIVPERVPFFIRPVARLLFNGVLDKMVEPRLKEHRAFIEGHLEESSTGWFAKGPNPTSADFMMIFPMEALQSRVPGSGTSKAVDKYVQMVHERPAYKRALEKAKEKGGEFKILPS